MKVNVQAKSNHKTEINKLQKKIKANEKKAMRKAVAPLRTKVRSEAPKLTGALKRALITKVDHSKKQVIYGIVGVKIDTYNKQNPFLYAKKIDQETRFLSGQDLKQYLDLYTIELKKEIQ